MNSEEQVGSRTNGGAASIQSGVLSTSDLGEKGGERRRDESGSRAKETQQLSKGHPLYLLDGPIPDTCGKTLVFTRIEAPISLGNELLWYIVIHITTDLDISVTQGCRIVRP